MHAVQQKEKQATVPLDSVKEPQLSFCVFHLLMMLLYGFAHAVMADVL